MATSSPLVAPRLSVALVSMSALAYEVLLMRLFSIIQWHHFAYMIISLALLGYGFSGTFLSLARGPLLARFRGAFVANVAAFGLSALGCFMLARQLPFNPQELLWDAGEPWRLMSLFLLLAVPFFFAANAVALALTQFGSRIPGIYAADLLGAGAGSLGVLALLFVVFPHRALYGISAIGLGAAAVAWWELRMRPRWEGALLLVIALIVLGLPGSWTQPQPSPYKSLSQTLRVPGAEAVAEASSPLGLLTAVRSDQVPLRYAPGMSLTAPGEPPPQAGIFTDGEGMTAVTRYSGRRSELAFLDQMSSALPYHLAQPERVLVLGAGGGLDVLQAKYHRAAHIDAVELNGQLIQLMRDELAEFAGGLYQSPGVKLHVAEARGFLASRTQGYDLIQISLLDAFAASASGLYALSENYLYTREALRGYLNRLRPGGYLAFTRWVKLPPRDNLKLFATAVSALESMGIPEAGQSLALIRSWQTATLVVKNGVFQASEIEALRTFCNDRGFDWAWYPGMEADEANRRNKLPRPYFHEAARALLGPERQQFLRDYKFNLEPPTDDRPYFYHFFKWGSLPEILSLRGRGGTALLESGYLVLVTTLVQALVVAALLILLPLWFLRRKQAGSRPRLYRTRVAAYFAAIGLAFLFLEIAFIQRFTLLLHHPLYSVAVVLTGFLVFAGLGSAWSARLANRRGAAVAPVAAVAVLGVSYLIALPPLFEALADADLAIRIAVSLALIAPLAVAMGMPFPLGLRAVSRHGPNLVPWAWGINGFASVISAVLATLLAVHFGFSVVVAAALMLYGLAVLAFPGNRYGPDPGREPER